MLTTIKALLKVWNNATLKFHEFQQLQKNPRNNHYFSTIFKAFLFYLNSFKKIDILQYSLNNWKHIFCDSLHSVSTRTFFIRIETEIFAKVLFKFHCWKVWKNLKVTILIGSNTSRVITNFWKILSIKSKVYLKRFTEGGHFWKKW